MAPPGLAMPNAAQPEMVAKIPVEQPPIMPATKWVWNTPRTSSTERMKGTFLPKMFMLSQGTVPEPKPIAIALQPAMTPAAGVMATRPQIIPLTAPITEGFL